MQMQMPNVIKSISVIVIPCLVGAIFGDNSIATENAHVFMRKLKLSFILMGKVEFYGRYKFVSAFNSGAQRAAAHQNNTRRLLIVPFIA